MNARDADLIRRKRRITAKSSTSSNAFFLAAPQPEANQTEKDPRFVVDKNGILRTGPQTSETPKP